MNNKLIYSVRCISSCGEYFKIHRKVFVFLIKDYDLILNSSLLVQTNSCIFVDYKKKYMLKRLISIKKTLIKLFMIEEKNNLQMKFTENKRSIPFLKSKSNDKVIGSSQNLDKLLKCKSINKFSFKSSESIKVSNVENKSINALKLTVNSILNTVTKDDNFYLNNAKETIKSPIASSVKDTINSPVYNDTKTIILDYGNLFKNEKSIVIGNTTRILSGRNVQSFNNINIKTTFNTINEKNEIIPTRTNIIELPKRDIYSSSGKKSSFKSLTQKIRQYETFKNPINFENNVRVQNTLFLLHSPIISYTNKEFFK